jgi:mono/diheme cytochrome c family protein
MKTIKYGIPIVVLVASAVLGTRFVVADRDVKDEGDDERWGESILRKWSKADSRMKNTQYSQLYQEECGSCHFPFQPVFLPADSWQTMMASLDDHFGENAELTEEDHGNLLNYLVSNAADKVNREIPNKVMWSLRYTPSPQRITETAFFRHEHNEIPPAVMNKKGGDTLSFSNCDSCHKRALQGSYDEREIDIPGIGRWDD